jgi:hypothetical protein
MIRAALLAALFGVSVVGGAARAETQLFAPENVSAWVDVRLISADGEPSWRAIKGEGGGFGKLRYGHESKVDVAQAAFNWKPRLTDTVTAYVLAQYTPGSLTDFGVSEAYVKWKPVPTSDLRWSVRFGQMFPPVSMEHDGPGWSVSRTITPSAINSWIGEEEVLVDGLELNVHKHIAGQDFGLTGAVFTGNDTSGTILSWRGWALHDVASDRQSRLPLPSGDNQGWYRLFDEYQAPFTAPTAEVDGHVGDYVRVDWRPPAPIAFNLEYYANHGNPQAVSHIQWGWETVFWNLGMQAKPAAKTEILAQYLKGKTCMGWPIGNGLWAIDTNYDAAYVLVSQALGGGATLTGRIDYFAVKDLSKRAVDDNTDKGYAATLAYMRPVSAHLDLAVEALNVQSNHPARVTHALAAHQSQTQLQIALKLHI